MFSVRLRRFGARAQAAVQSFYTEVEREALPKPGVPAVGQNGQRLKVNTYKELVLAGMVPLPASALAYTILVVWPMPCHSPHPYRMSGGAESAEPFVGG